MLKVQEIRELIKLIDDSTIDEFEYEVDGAKIAMKKGGTHTEIIQTPIQQPIQPALQPVQTAAPAVAPQPVSQEQSSGPEQKEATTDDSNLHKIESPMVGTFYSSPSPDADVFVKAGAKVDKDSVVCIVEAMKLFNEIEADVKGEIVEILAENGQLVEYGQPLFLVKAE
ncbi:biotin carboxyl carrier protein [Scopulibacillus darangshiensis]|uniref:Biotin carboxyl carrier protein of acetyl-CoA carboxylase n=1 Tax=Scopulibacillus darangshiensis TaxID=442528 RepID=A0A4R2PAQ3_9BACL|nr:acetyl-CoA carboxylase biotin carboxyl carrier protein [Scopulibacillus darangshiensis]TCP31181.1 biotin carboxyl carrier protein [Scopulibacillus darangshiensis]